MRLSVARKPHCAWAPRGRAAAACRAVQNRNGTTRTVARRVNVSSDEDYENTPDRLYINFTGFPFPIGPLLYRKTTLRQVAKGTIWVLEQPQTLAFSNVAVNVRCTLVKLSCGGLLVFNPIAPTQECVRFIQQLDIPVKYIVLGTAAYEHKVFVGPFSRRFPSAKVYVAPQQFSFPLDLPVQLYGIFPKAVLKHNDTDTPWAADLEQKVLSAPKFAVAGYYSEVALYHKASRTVLVTDSVVELPRKPPDCISPATLLDNAKNGFVIKTADRIYCKADVTGRIYDAAPVPDTPGNRLRGWQRICLLVCFFGPSGLYDPTDSFDQYAGRPFVFPVVGSLVFSRAREAVREWIEDMAADWNFRQIVPSHFGAPVQCNGQELIAAFQRSTDIYRDVGEQINRSNQQGVGLLQQLLALRRAGSKPGETVLNPDDLQALENVNWFLEALRAVNKR